MREKQPQASNDHRLHLLLRQQFPLEQCHSDDLPGDGAKGCRKRTLHSMQPEKRLQRLAGEEEPGLKAQRIDEEVQVAVCARPGPHQQGVVAGAAQFQLDHRFGQPIAVAFGAVETLEGGIDA